MWTNESRNDTIWMYRYLKLLLVCYQIYIAKTVPFHVGTYGVCVLLHRKIIVYHHRGGTLYLCFTVPLTSGAFFFIFLILFLYSIKNESNATKKKKCQYEKTETLAFAVDLILYLLYYTLLSLSFKQTYLSVSSVSCFLCWCDQATISDYSCVVNESALKSHSYFHVLFCLSAIGADIFFHLLFMF